MDTPLNILTMKHIFFFFKDGFLPHKLLLIKQTEELFWESLKANLAL